MPKWLLTVLHFAVAAGSVATALNFPNTKWLPVVIAVGAGANALLPSPVATPPLK